MDASEDADERELRRRQLAKRLVSHRARTQTVYEFTGLSRHRLETLRRRWGVSAEDRHRGPSPTSFAEFFRSTRSLQAATAAALLCQLLGIPCRSNPDARRRGGSLDTGERLCYVYEALQACFPQMEFEFEHLVLLVRGLAGGMTLQLGACSRCGAAMLVDMLAAPGADRMRCRACRTELNGPALPA